MLAEHLCCQTDSLVGHKRTVCEYIQRQLIVVRDLAHTGILNSNIDSFHRRVDRINSDHTNRQILRLVLIRSNIAPASCDGQLHVKLCILTTQGSNHQIGI